MVLSFLLSAMVSFTCLVCQILFPLSLPVNYMVFLVVLPYVKGESEGVDTT